MNAGPQASGPWRLHPSLLVTIRADGLQLQQHSAAPNRPITLAGALTLARLSQTPSVTDLQQLKADMIERAGGSRKLLDQLLFAGQNGGRIMRSEQPLATLGEAIAPNWSLESAPKSSSPSRIELLLPIVFRPWDGHFEAIGPDGSLLLRVDAYEVRAIAELTQHPTVDEAYAAHVADAGEGAIERQRFVDIIDCLAAHQLVVPEGFGTPHIEMDQGMVKGHGAAQRLREEFRAHALRLDAAEADRAASTGSPIRPKVIPVAFDLGPPTALGSIFAYAKVYADGALDDFYDFRTDWHWDDDRIDDFTREPAIYLFSNYLWSHEKCVDISAKIKAKSPNSITVHGGPDTPKYPLDCTQYFERFPHVDITVRGEGELTAADLLDQLRSVIGTDNPDLSVLQDVAGLSYRGASGRAVHTPDRERIADLDILPSSFLNGMMDTYINIPDLIVILETNRGCPYGCTFCDWGSATASRIRKFDHQRVLDEITWCSDARVTAVSIADANFGIFARDVEYANHAAALKTGTGFPKGFGGNYAKNTVKHLSSIIAVLADADILTQGTLSLQSMDEVTLDAIHRSNIKTEKYDALAREMREADLPLMIELMMGLPGSTLRSFRHDLQSCIDRELPARVNHTTLLVNSPMNDPDYLAEHKIKTRIALGPGQLAALAETSSYNNDDLREMERTRVDFIYFDMFGVLRTVARFVHQEVGLSDIDFYAQLRHEATTTDRWPVLGTLASLGPSMMAPPVSWTLMINELRTYVVEKIGLPDDSALDAILRCQLAVLPAHGRVFPEVIELSHDVGAWWSAMLAVKDTEDRAEWTGRIPRLSTYGPAALTVEDPRDVCRQSIGINHEINIFGINWELDSQLSRARTAVNAL